MKNDSLAQIFQGFQYLTDFMLLIEKQVKQ